jgi:CMP-N,N'-diacetyllegionaminic acid synthase
MPPTVLGVVTARAGSKGLPGKNTRALAGKPLIAHTIDAARASAAFDRLVLSTDDDQAAAIARAHGCDVPFMRPVELAVDTTPHLAVMVHAVEWLRDHEDYLADWTMILMPTSPLRQPRHIVEAIELATRSDVDSVVSVDEMPAHYNPMRAVTIDERGLARLFVGGRPVRERPNRRQDMPPVWVLNGAIYLFRTSLLFEAEPTLYGDRVAAYVMPPPYGHNIDDEADWIEAERLLLRSDR